MRRRRWRRVTLGLGAVALAAGLALALSLAALDTEAVRSRLRPILVRAAAAAVGAEVSLGRISRLGLAGATLRHLELAVEGRSVLRAERLAIRPRIESVFPPTLSLSLELRDFELRVSRGPDGRLDLSRLGGGGEEGEARAALPISRIRWRLARGSVRLETDGEPVRLRRAGLRGGITLGRGAAPTVWVERATARAGRLALRASGWITAGAGAPLRLDLSFRGVVGARLSALAGGLRPGLGVDGWASVRGTLAAPSARAHLEAAGAAVDLRAALRPGRSAGRAPLWARWRVESLDPARIWTSAPVGRVAGGGDVSLDPARPLESFVARARLERSVLAGLRLAALDVAARPKNGRLRVSLEARGPERAFSVSARGGIGIGRPRSLRLAARFELEDSAGLPPEAARRLAASRVEGRLDLKARRPWDEGREIAARLSLGPGELWGRPLTRASARVEVSGRRMWLSELDWVAGRSRVGAEGWARLGEDWRPAALALRARGPLDLSVVPGMAGLASLDLSLRGGSDGIGGTLRLETVDGLVTRDLAARLDVRAEAARLGRPGATMELRATGRARPRGWLAGVAGAEARAVELSASWQGAASAGSGIARLSLRASEKDGRLHALRTWLEAAGARPERIHIEELRLAPAIGGAWELARPSAVTLVRGGIEVGALELRSRGGRIRLEGGLDPSGPNDLRVSIEGLDLSVACALAGVRGPCAGPLDGWLEVAGSGPRPALSGRVEVPTLELGDRRYGRLELELSGARTLSLRGSLLDAGVRRISVSARAGLAAGWPLPALDRRAPLSLDVRASGLALEGLSGLAGTSVSELDGEARMELHASGTMAAPRVSGDLELRDVALGLATSGVLLRNGHLHLRLSNEALTVVDAELGDAAVRAGGEIRLDRGRPADTHLWLELRDAPLLDRPEAHARASGRLELDGAIGEGLRLAGELEVDPATLRPMFSDPGEGPAVDPTIVVVRGPEDELARAEDALGHLLSGEPAAPRFGRRPGLASRLEVAVRVRLGDEVVVSRPDAHARLEGELEIEKAPGGVLRVLGEISAAQAWYIFQGRRLEVEHARVSFSGGTPVDPALDVLAETRAGDYEVSVRLRGTLAEPELTLAATPPLPESDVLAVLLFGKPTADLTSGEGGVLQQQALGLVETYVAPDLRRSVMDTFGLSALTVSLPSDTQAGSVAFGRYFGRDLFVSLAQAFGGPRAGSRRQLSGLAGTSVTVQYQLTPRITIRSASSTEGESSVDVIWHKRY